MTSLAVFPSSLIVDMAFSDRRKDARLTTRSMAPCTALRQKTRTDLMEGRFLKCFQSSINFSTSSASGTAVPFPVAFYGSVRSVRSAWVEILFAYHNAAGRVELDRGAIGDVLLQLLLYRSHGSFTYVDA